MESLFEPRILMNKYVDSNFIKKTILNSKKNEIEINETEAKSLIQIYFNYYVCDPLEPLSVEQLKEYYIMAAKMETSLKDNNKIIKTIKIIGDNFKQALESYINF